MRPATVPRADRASPTVAIPRVVRGPPRVSFSRLFSRGVLTLAPRSPSPRTQEERRIRKERQKAKEKARLGKSSGSVAKKPSGTTKPEKGSALPENRLKRHTAFLCPIEFKNDLPPVPVDWKFLSVPVATDSFTKYSHLDLEDERRKDVALVSDLGITLDPMVAAAFRAPNDRPPIHPADLALLEDGDGAKPRTGIVDQRKKKVKRPDLSKALWLMNTQYISSASLPEHLGRSEQAYAKGKAKRGGDGAGANADGDDGRDPREAQIESIEASFAAAARAPVHPTAPKTTKPLEVIPVLPDFERWAGDHLHFVFDEDPCKGVAALAGADDRAKSAAMERAIAKPFTVTTSEGPSKVLGLMLPADPSRASAFAKEGEEEEYAWTREYKYAVEPEPDPSLGTCVFFFDDAAKTARYVELNTKISLSKRSKYGAAGETPAPVPSKITVRRRAPDDAENAARKRARATLENPELAAAAAE